MKLSKNFSLNEFTTSAGLALTPTSQQIFCLLVLAKNVLQPIRDQYGRIKITSGLRNKESYEKLISQGYAASKTSDHFAWSDINPKGTGAADFYCASPSPMLCSQAKPMEIVFKWIIRNLYNKCRQIIYYPDMNFIHVSNNFNTIFTMEDNISTDKQVLIKKNNTGFVPYINF